MGDSDEIFGCDPDGTTCNRLGIRAQQELITGQSCGATAFDCIASDGSGYYIVQASEIDNGSAPHCFTYRRGACGLGFDPNYESNTSVWSLDPSLDWLAGFGDL